MSAQVDSLAGFGASLFEYRMRPFAHFLRRHPFSEGREDVVAAVLQIIERAHPLSAKLDQVLRALRNGSRPAPANEEEENLIRFLWDLRDLLRADPEAADFPADIEGILRDVRECAGRLQVNRED